MTRSEQQLAAVLAKIRQCDPATRYRHQPELQSLISRRIQAGDDVPARVRCLNSELVSEAVEARFDNMPV